jgi:WD40 repeat protein
MKPQQSLVRRPRGDDGVPRDWVPGDVILDLYEVRELPGMERGYAEGGMGRVNLVWHRGWQMQLAVKSVRPDKLQSHRYLECFQREAEVRVNKLGLHPNIVSCYYVRVLGGLPRVFIDYVDGGSLEEWIRSGKLYEGGPEQALERILDIAIQFAWGLHHAHEQGLIHQDVKPNNLMMTADGVARVTDFGLASARAALGEGGKRPASCTLLATGSGMAEMYCSPEQADIKAQQKAGLSRKRWPKLTRRTDIWSWAVSALEMFLGETPWPSGIAVHHYLKTQAEDPRIPRMLPAVVELLHRCLQPCPEDRPHDLLEAAGSLQAIYQQACGKAYPREAPKAAELLADSLNNRAVSLADLGKQEEAEKGWAQALQMDPLHPEATCNLGLAHWRRGRIDDIRLLEQLRAVCTGSPDRWDAAYYLALVHLERDDCGQAIKVLEALDATAAGRDEVQRLLAQAKDRLPQSRRCLCTFEDQEDGLICGSLSSDGRLALSGSWAGTLKLWEVSSGRCLRTFKGHTKRVESVCLSSDGRLALSGSWAGTLKLWEVSSGRCLRIFGGHTPGVSSVCLSSDGRLALSDGDFHRVGPSVSILKLWEVSSGRCLRTFEGHMFTFCSFCLSSDGRLVLSGSNDRTLKLWEVSDGRCLSTFEGHSHNVTSVCLSSDGRLAFSGSLDKTLKLWEVSSGRCLRTFQGHTEGVESVCLSSDGRLALSGSEAGTLKLWEVSCGRCLRTLQGHTEGVKSVCLSSDALLALSVSEDKTLKLWDICGNHTRVPTSAIVRRPTEDTRLTQKTYQQLLAGVDQEVTRGEDPGLVVVSLRQARRLTGCGRRPEVLVRWFAFYLRLPRVGLLAAWKAHTFEGHKESVNSVCLSSDGCLALSGSDDSLMLWEVLTGRCLRNFEFSANSVCWSRDGRLALSGSKGPMVRLWDVAGDRCLDNFEWHSHGVRVSSVCLSSDCRLALSGSEDGKLVLWNAASGLWLRNFKEFPPMCLSSDDCLVLSTSDDTLKLWEVASGRCLRTFEGHTRRVSSLCLSSDGRLALSGSSDLTLKLWDLSSGRCLRTFEGHTSNVSSVCLSSDGRLALSGSWDRTMKLWEVASGRCLRTFEGHTRPVSCVCLSSDGRLALSASHDRTVQVWILDWDLEARRRSEWDEGARPYLEVFLSAQTFWAAELPDNIWFSEEELSPALTRCGRPRWTESDFERLLFTLGCAGFGWLRPEGVRRELEKMAASWQGPPPLA